MVVLYVDRMLVTTEACRAGQRGIVQHDLVERGFETGSIHPLEKMKTVIVGVYVVAVFAFTW